MSLYLSSPNAIRKTIAARVITKRFSSPLLSPLCRHVNPRRARTTRRALRHIFYRGTHSGRYRAYCLLSRDLYAFAIFPSHDWARQGWLEKSRCVVWLDDTHWNARGYTQRANDICRSVPRGADFIPRLARATRPRARYRGYYFPRIFFVISANCTRRAAGLSEDLRRAPRISRNAQLPPFLSSKQVRTYSVFRRFRSGKLCRAIARQGNLRQRCCPVFLSRLFLSTITHVF